MKMAHRISAARCIVMRFPKMWEEQQAWEKRKSFLLAHS